MSDWIQQAACTGQTALFFPIPQSNGPRNWTEAGALCNQCTVRRECAADGLEPRDLYADVHGYRAGVKPVPASRIVEHRVDAYRHGLAQVVATGTAQ